RAQIRGGPAVRRLREHAAGSNGQVIQQEAPLGERRLGAAERHVDRDDLDRWAFLDEDDRHERVAALRQLEVIRDARMVVPVRPVELTQPIEIRAEHDGVEEGPGPPHREPRPGRRGPAGRRRASLAAAETLLARGGEAGLSIRELCARASVTPPTVYHHFGDKGALVDRLVDECFAEFDRTFTRRRPPADPVEALRWGFARYVEYGLAHP